MEDKIRELAEKGYNFTHIANEVGLHRTTVSKICRNYEINIVRVINTNCKICDKDLGENPKNRSNCGACITRIRRYRIKQQAVEYKGGKCEKCGYDRCYSALEFHHLNPNEKDFGIADSAYSRSWETIKKELDKCIMVCSNCHAEIHDKYDDKLKQYIESS